MYEVYGGKSIDQYRSEQLEAARKHLQIQQRLDKEHEERTRAEEKAAQGSAHEQALQQLTNTRDKVLSIQLGSPGAFAAMKANMLNLIIVMQYILQAVDPNREKQGEAAQ